MARVRGTHMHRQTGAKDTRALRQQRGRRGSGRGVLQLQRGWTQQREEGGEGEVAEWTVDATQNVSDIICQNKLFDVVASQRKCVYPPSPLFPRARVLDDSLPGVCSSAPVLSITLSLLPRSLPRSLPPVSLFCCVCLQTTTNCCLMHDRLMPPAPCHMPLATCHSPHLPHACPAPCLSLLSRLASSALPKSFSSSFAASSALCAPSHAPTA